MDGGGADIVADAEGPREMSADEEQRMRLRAYDEMAGESAMAFLRETRSAVLPSTVTHVLDGGVDVVTRSANVVMRSVPEPIKSAASFTGHQISHIVEVAGGLVEQAPGAVINVIPEALMSRETKQLVFVDFVNVLRCFFHTNILSIPYIFRSAGLVGGLVMTLLVAIISLYCTESFFAAKYQLRKASEVFIYGDVPRMTWGRWFPSLNIFYGVVHVVGFLAFASSNMQALFDFFGWNISNEKVVALITTPLIATPLVFMKRAGSQRSLGLLSSILVLTSGFLMMIDFPYNAETIALYPESPQQFFIALGVSVFAFTGIGSAVPVERTMSPRRFTLLQRTAVPTAYLLLVGFGLCGFLSFGAGTCAVLTRSLALAPATATAGGAGAEAIAGGAGGAGAEAIAGAAGGAGGAVGGRAAAAASVVLSVALVLIVPQHVFPLAELMDRSVLGMRHLPAYGEVGPNLLRLGILAGCAIIAYVVPYYGLILAFAGAFSCGIVGIIVPAALDYVRRRRTALHEGRPLKFREYLVCFMLGVFGAFVVILGVAFGLFNLWIDIQANSTTTC